jgi:hypothetical protein
MLGQNILKTTRENIMGRNWHQASFD